MKNTSQDFLRPKTFNASTLPLGKDYIPYIKADVTLIRVKFAHIVFIYLLM
ncbi:hypothetical protein SAMN05660349_03095 [Macellibacteroides fermentans]|uniref:Uncharacterized protein n=1 Tax=Parabacteroides chartae TaxID=1037355 RepID=A0A1T5ER65_9BACT|nr:hypothetical protein SAMN05660349_03095 [Parabacteroides chartae]